MYDDITGIEEEKRFVKALKSRDTKAYSIFYDHYAAALNGIISGIVEDKKIREKVLTELLCDIWKDIDNYRPDYQRLFSWMVRKARLRALNANLKYKLNAKQKTEPTYTPVFNMKPKIGAKSMIGHLEGITKDEMRIFDLIYYKGLTIQSVAKKQNLKIEEVRLVVRKVVTKARNTFKV